jgi:glycosyltransferase involved in cell wall biosynthesis
VNQYRFETIGSPHTGYGQMGDQFRRRLADRVEFRRDAEAAVFACPPHMAKDRVHNQRAACFTMWETDVLPQVFVRSLPLFDKILVPSEFCRELFSEHHDDVSVVPLGVDIGLWSPKGGQKGPYRFITSGSSWPRKGIQTVIDAFIAADIADAELIVKLTDSTVELPTNLVAGNNITVLKETLSVDAEVELYRSADCFVSGSNGEGFGLIPLQNIALGNTVIAPAHTGHLEFVDLIDYPLASEKMPAMMKAWPDAGFWWRPVFDEMVDAMRSAAEGGRRHHQTKRRVAKQVEVWSWDAATDRLLEVFPPAGVLDGVIQAVPVTVQVQALTDVYADIGTHRLRAKRDDVFEVPVETVAQLLESGVIREL